MYSVAFMFHPPIHCTSPHSDSRSDAASTSTLATRGSQVTPAQQQWVRCLTVFKDKVWSGSDDNSVRVWSIDGDGPLMDCPGHEVARCPEPKVFGTRDGRAEYEAEDVEGRTEAKDGEDSANPEADDREGWTKCEARLARAWFPLVPPQVLRS